jgi:glycogen operon protein
MLADPLPGLSFPLGATVMRQGTNFSVASKDAEAIELLLFDSPEAAQPARVIRLDPTLNRTSCYWHIFVPGVQEGQIYAYRAYGPYQPAQGIRVDGSKVLLDPYARAIVGWQTYDRQAAAQQGMDNCATALRSVAVAPSTLVMKGMASGNYDWEGDASPDIPLSKSVIYEMHVGGFTRNPNSGVAPEKRGTYAGVIEKIPYLKQLGVTAVELLPVHAFDESDARPGLKNYWGYSTIGFFAPHPAYSSRLDPLGAVHEFRDMVKALHRAGIEVILDVVFNHTAEGNEHGPTLSYRGLWNDAYYSLEPDKTYYSNYTGCGNTVEANHPIARNLIIDSLRYWVAEMHVDGFRFDLAASLSRDYAGRVLEASPVLMAIETDPILVNAKIIAEAWDAAGLYQVGSFVQAGDRFAEWNGPFRDDIRRFVKGDAGMVGKLASRLMGSPDLYPRLDYDTARSINFITCHDGFTLNDLVSYNHKHNDANGENNRDGGNDNHSWNCGEEGASQDPEVEALRSRQVKNLLTLLFLAQGTPMLLMGDEVRHTQQGNNNAYCQDNALSWFDWDDPTRQAGLLRFTQGLIAFTQSLPLFAQDRVLLGFPMHKDAYVTWHGTHLGQPSWDEHSRCLALTLHDSKHQTELHIMFNAYWDALRFELPALTGGNRWYRIIDTALSAPDDYSPLEKAVSIAGSEYWLTGRSSVVLMKSQAQPL